MQEGSVAGGRLRRSCGSYWQGWSREWRYRSCVVGKPKSPAPTQAVVRALYKAANDLKLRADDLEPEDVKKTIRKLRGVLRFLEKIRESHQELAACS